MILKALYDYYQRCAGLPAYGMEEKEIGFVVDIDSDGRFLQIEDCRIDKHHAKTFVVAKHIERSGSTAWKTADYLYEKIDYALGWNEKKPDDAKRKCGTFADRVREALEQHPDSADLKALAKFYEADPETIADRLSGHPLWKDLARTTANISFRLHGDTRIIAEKAELMPSDEAAAGGGGLDTCLVTGQKCEAERLSTTTLRIAGGHTSGSKLISFQASSGYDSYGKTQSYNAPISPQADFQIATALGRLIAKDSRNKFTIGTSRTFLFWSAADGEAGSKAEDSLFDLLGFQDDADDDPNARIESVRKVFTAIYSGTMRTSSNDKFYILGLAPNSKRIAVAYWAEIPLQKFAGQILRHFADMEIADNRKDKRPYAGIRAMLSAVTLGGKASDATPNMPEAIAKSIFQGLPYPQTLYSACLRRIRAESRINTPRAAIIKACLNRMDNNNKKITTMLDTNNTNAAYLCGRLFATLDYIQERAAGISTIRERYINAASATPAAVFPTILNLSLHHSEKLNEGSKIHFEKMKQEIIAGLPAEGFPAHLDMQDQGRFFVGYYHQRQDYYTSKQNTTNE